MNPSNMLAKNLALRNQSHQTNSSVEVPTIPTQLRKQRLDLGSSKVQHPSPQMPTLVDQKKISQKAVVIMGISKVLLRISSGGLELLPLMTWRA